MPAACSTLGCTMPQPPHSIQRAPPLKVGCQTSISALGSVNGKKLGRRRIFASSPKIDFTKWSRVPLRCAIVRPLSTARPSNCMNTGRCVASNSSVR